MNESNNVKKIKRNHIVDRLGLDVVNEKSGNY
jgi:hypothetical protein